MGNQLGKSGSSSSFPKVLNNDELIRIVMVGKTGAGKIATGNTILGEKCFKSQFSVTKNCKKADGEVNGQKVAVINTSSLFNNITERERAKYIAQCITYASPGPLIFLVVIRLGRFTEEEKQTVQKIQEIFGEEANKYSMILFTHGDDLKGKPIKEFLEGSKDLKKLVDKCNGQYHVFNNDEKEDRSQVSELLKKIRNINEKNGGTYYTTEMFQKAKRQALTVFNNDELIRIVMVGKTGAGKSASGNTILGEECFKSEFSPKSLTTCCEKFFGLVDGQWVAVIDTPGLFDTKNTEEKQIQDISKSIAYASPGPHVFLIVTELGRFTEEEKQTVQKIQDTFGKEANKYSMFLFTHGDQLKGKPIKEFLEESDDLQELVAKYNNQYHVFNNEVKDHSQVSELLKKIRKIMKNEGGYYRKRERRASC